MAEPSHPAQPDIYPVDENLFYSAPTQPLEPTNAAADHVDEHEHPACPEPTEEALPPPPNFKPFFTLIEGPTATEHHHPMVHYIFADDDPEILTAAALDSLDQADGGGHQPHDVEERFIVVDMAADGKTVTSASSMSPHWQVLRTAVSAAPSWGDTVKGAEGASMLKVTGQERSAAVPRMKRQQRHVDVDELVTAFKGRLEGLEELASKNVPQPNENENLDSSFE